MLHAVLARRNRETFENSRASRYPITMSKERLQDFEMFRYIFDVLSQSLF